jgi:hypothetical protein
MKMSLSIRRLARAAFFLMSAKTLRYVFLRLVCFLFQVLFQGDIVSSRCFFLRQVERRTFGYKPDRAALNAGLTDRGFVGYSIFSF